MNEKRKLTLIALSPGSPMKIDGEEIPGYEVGDMPSGQQALIFKSAAVDPSPEGRPWYIERNFGEGYREWGDRYKTEADALSHLAEDVAPMRGKDYEFAQQTAIPDIH
jgi:hypothetical protein